MALVYSIRDWDEHFENAASRKVETLSWVAMPVKHDGKSFRRIMLMDDAAEIFTSWVLIVQVAAKCPKRGVLCDEDGPLDATDLAIKTGFRETSFANALNVLSSPKIGWLDQEELVASYQTTGSALALQGGNGKEGRKEDCGTPAKPSLPPPSDPSSVAFPEFPCVPGRKSGPRTWLLTADHLAELASTFPALDVPAEARKAHGWVKANLAKRKTHDGMADFLYRWMAREQNRGGHRSGNGQPGPVPETTGEFPPRRKTT